MKKANYALLKLFVIVACFITISCSKDDDNEPATTPTKTPEQLLTANAWKPNELRAIQDGTAYYYKRGTTVSPNYNLDNESILFRADKTGSYTGTEGNTYPFTWEFTNAEKTKLTWVLQVSPNPITIYWEINILKEGYLRYDEHYTRGTWNTITFGDRTPK